MYNIQKVNFNYQYYFFFIKNLEFFSLNYVLLYFITLSNILNLLNLIFIKKNIIQEKKLNKNSKNLLVINSRIKKENKVQILQFLNISEFVYNEQKEIYSKKFIRSSFFLKNNLILQKQFIIEKLYYKRLDKFFNAYFMKIKSIGNIFFIQYRIYGLGFKLK